MAGIDEPHDLAEFARRVRNMDNANLLTDYKTASRKMHEGFEDTLAFVSTNKRVAIYTCELIKRGLL